MIAMKLDLFKVFLKCLFRKHNGNDISKEYITNSETRMIHHGLKECTFTLTIPSSQHGDTGEFTFTAVNKSGEATSKVSTILPINNNYMYRLEKRTIF